MGQRFDAVRRVAAVLAIVGAVALSACAGPVSDADEDAGVDAVGTWGDPSAEQSAYLSLASDGSLTGSDGCNRLTGTWRVDPADQVEFEDVASTRMACEGVDTPLAGLEVATISGDTMTVYAAGDAVIATLERSSDDPE